MTINLAHMGLAINSPLIKSTEVNFRPPSWPPPSDWPVVIDATGEVVSRWGEPEWRLDLWAGKRMTLNFGDGYVNRITDPISSANANLLRQVAGWWLWGPSGVQSAATLKFRFNILRGLFVQCSRKSIVASDLMRFPKVADTLPQVFSPSGANVALMLLHRLYDQREYLGFTLLDRDGLARLVAAQPEHSNRQTAYIPPRIWMYQVKRLRELLDDFLAHSKQVEACFHFCLDAYVANYGSMEQAVMCKKFTARNPFCLQVSSTGARTGVKFHGAFRDTAKRFGIDQLLQRWVINLKEGEENYSVDTLSAYMSMVGKVGVAYILNFSLMRSDEAWNLRTDCLEIERDPMFGEIYILRGETRKTLEDYSARWPTSPSVKVAIDAMKNITRMRMICAEVNPSIQKMPVEMSNHYLLGRSYEPWAGTKERDAPYLIRPKITSYGSIITKYPRLFDIEELRITDADLKLARYVTLTLDATRFAVGNIWPLAWHQLRRTGAVNMQASGLVSDASLQYLLKHASRAMSLYYGQGYSRVNLNDEAKMLYIRTMYEVLGKEFEMLLTDRFVSPHGETRKAEIVKLIDPLDAKKLTSLSKSGQISWRDILLGGCAKRGPCPFGGVESVAHCGGGDSNAPCADVLYDREKLTQVRKLGRIIDQRLIDAPDGTPVWESLKAQKRSVENFIHVIAEPY